MVKELTPKQKKFVEEYLIDLNATQAAIRAGYFINEKPPEHGYYTYALICPLRGAVFYIGKGKADRVYCHRGKPIGGAEKIKRLENIINSGMELNFIILSTHIDESEAYDVEDILIDVFGYDNLTNVSRDTGVAKEDITPLLPSVYEYNHTKDWAAACLRILEPVKGRIMFMGKLLEKSSEDIIFNVLYKNYFNGVRV